MPSKTAPDRSGRLSIDSWTEQHPQILFSRISAENIAERARSRSRSGGVLSTTNTASAGIRRHPPARAAHTCPAPKFLPGRLDNPCLLPDSHRPKPRRSHYQIPPRLKREQRPKHAPCKRRDSPRILAMLYHPSRRVGEQASAMELRLASFRSSCLPPRIIKRISRTARARANARTRVGKSFCSLSRPAPSTTGGALGVNQGYSNGTWALHCNSGVTIGL